MDRVRAHELALVERTVDLLAGIDGVRVYGPADVQRRSGAVSFTLEGVHPHDIATILDERGVCVRAGHHCAQPLMRRLDVPATARASVYVYTTGEDLEALAAAVRHARDLFMA
jgi:cysteine desulfurase/selenocysteine lyase